jgi:cytoskeletal protein CcmA (bactofilin family)
VSWFGRSSRAKSPLFEDRPSLIGEAAAREEKAPAEASAEDLAAHFFKGSRVTGQLVFHGAAEIDGGMTGAILCRGTLTVGESAEVHASIAGDVVVIRGHVEGDVTAREKIELNAPARLLGNVDSPRLIISEGVVFDGDCAMGGAAVRRAPPAAAD